MRVLRILITAFVAGIFLASCESPTAPCRDRTIIVDTLGWVVRAGADTVGPITARHPACIVIA